MTTKAKVFTSKGLTPTKFDTAEDKARMGNQLIAFIDSGFDRALFTKPLYKRLSMMFGHIAHYDQAGFYSVWFSNTRSQYGWLRRISNYDAVGDPAWTWCDVERVITAYVKAEGLVAEYSARVQQESDEADRAEYLRLKAKFEGGE